MTKKVASQTSATDCTRVVESIYVMKKVGPETSPTDCTWTVQPIYTFNIYIYIHLIYVYIYNSESMQFIFCTFDSFLFLHI
jgi:hypothetical protein